MPKMITKTDGLNLRSSAEILPDNIIVSMPLGQEVNVINAPTGQRFWEVETDINGTTKHGFASSKFLREPVGARRESLLSHAVKEWIRFKRGDAKENVDPFFKRVGDYWQAINVDLDGRDTSVPWSAAFMSFIVRQAGYDNFKFSDSHDKYIVDAKKKRLSNTTSAPYWLFRLNEHKPRLGDLVCGWRVNRRTFDDLPEDFASHTDVVVEVDDFSITTIGGNVSNSVNEKRFALNSNGFLKAQGQLFAIMRNNDDLT